MTKEGQTPAITLFPLVTFCHERNLLKISKLYNCMIEYILGNVSTVKIAPLCKKARSQRDFAKGAAKGAQ